MLRETATLEGKALDWAVSKAIGEYRPTAVPAYSTDWGLAGPIIEREMINTSPRLLSAGYGLPDGKWIWQAYVLGPTNIGDNSEMRGETLLVAAMRCYVTSKLGETVDIPEELT